MFKLDVGHCFSEDPGTSSLNFTTHYLKLRSDSTWWNKVGLSL